VSRSSSAPNSKSATEAGVVTDTRNGRAVR
jgi:hypothetical protein